MKKNSNNTFKLGAGVVGLAVVASIGIGLMGSTHVSVGDVGIVKHLNGQVTEVPQGWNWVGFGVGVEKLSASTQSLVLSNKQNEGGEGNGQWKVGSADQQELSVNTSLTWNISTKDATALYQSVGGKDMDYIRDSIVEPTMKTIVNQITHDYGWNDIKGAKQGEITERINVELGKALMKQGIKIGTFGFTEVLPPDGMAKSQQSLATAELGKQQALAKQQQQAIENETNIAKATADAKVKEIAAQATSKQAAALSPLVIQQEWIDAWRANGAPVPHTIIGSNGNTMMYQLPAEK